MGEDPIKLDNLVHDESDGGSHSMRALLAVCIKEAVKLALIDSAAPDERDESGMHRLWTDEERAAMRHDIHLMPSSALANMDPVALGQNVVIRLLGSGGWMVGGIYAGNATPREVFEATIERPDQDVIAELAFDMGLKPTEDGTFEMPEQDDEDIGGGSDGS